MKTLGRFSIAPLLATVVFALATPTLTRGQEKADDVLVLPYGFLETNSEQIPKAYRASVAKVAKAVGRLQVRAKVDLSAKTKKGDLVQGGTGFVTKSGEAVTTSFHVVDLWDLNPEKLEVNFLIGDETILIEKLISASKDNDLAQLALPKKREAFLEESTVELEAGLSIMTIGYPLSHPKQKVAFGILARKKDGLITLTNPSLEGNSGGPALVIEKDGEIKSYIGTVTAVIATTPDPDVKGASSVDYMGFMQMNRRFTTLLSYPDPEKTLKIVKGDKEHTSKLIEAWMKPEDDLIYETTKYNFDLLRGDDRLKKLAGNVISAAKATETFAKDLAPLEDWNKITRALLVTDYLKVNDYFAKEADAMARFGTPLYNGALQPEASIKAAVAAAKSPKEVAPYLLGLAERMRASEKQLQARVVDDKKKMEFLQSADKIAAYLLAVKKEPALLDGEKHLNDHLLYAPTAVVPNKKK